MKKAIPLLVIFILSTLSLSAQDSAVDFKKDLPFEQALALAGKDNKNIFIDFYTTWCAPCKVMDSEVFTKRAVGDYLNKGFVNLKIDAEKGEGISLARKYNVRAYPTFVVLNAKGEEVHRIEGGSTASLFLEKLEKGLDSDRSPAALAKRYKEGERSSQLVNDYVLSLMEADNEKEGFRVVNDYFNSLSDKDKVKKENFFLYERYAIRLEDEKAHYLLRNKEAFFKNNGKVETYKLMQRFLRTELVPYANGYRYNSNTYDQATFEALKKQISEAQFPDSLSLEPLIQIVEARKIKDQSALAFLETCEKIFPSLTKSDRFLLMLSFSEFKGNADKKVPLKALQIIEKYSHEISSATINAVKSVAEGLREKVVADGIQFQKLSFQEALNKAKKENKLIFLDAYTDWCGPCKEMEKNIFPQKEVGDLFNANFINLQIDMEKGEGPGLMKRYPINAFPTFLLIDGDGKEVHRLVGYHETKPFLVAIRKGMVKENTLGYLKEQYDAGNRDPKDLKNYADALSEASKKRELFQMLNSYFESLSEQDRKKVENAFVYKNSPTINDARFAYFLKNKDELSKNFGAPLFNEIVDHVAVPILVNYQSEWKNPTLLPNQFSELLTLNLSEKSETRAMLQLIKLASEGDKDKIIVFLDKEVEKFSDVNRIFALYQLLSIPVSGTDAQKAALKPLLTKVILNNPNTSSKENLTKFLDRLEKSM